MSRTAVVAWGVALLLAVAIAAQVVHARSARIHACARVGEPVKTAPLVPKKACAQARVQEHRTLLIAGVAGLTIVMATVVAVALVRDR